MMESISLLVVSDQDIGSTVQGEALLDNGNWIESAPVQNGRVWHHSNAPVHLWWRNESHLFSDYLDQTYHDLTDFVIKEVLFLSRHVAASGMPSLTLHCIGVLGVEPIGEPAEHGIPNKCASTISRPVYSRWKHWRVAAALRRR